MTRTSAHLALILAAAFWGFGNISQKLVLDHIGPMSAVSLRCAIAVLAVLPLLAFERSGQAKSGYWFSILGVSAAFAAALILQQLAYLFATVTNASFLVNTATVITPLIAWLLFREYPGRAGAFAASLTLAGIFLMSAGATGLSAMNAGDMACIVSAFFYAVWMIWLGRHAQTYGLPFRSALLQFAVASLVALPALLWWEATTLGQIEAAATDLLVLGIFTTAGAFGLQTVAQRYTSASKAAVLVSAESIFGAAGAYVFLGERASTTVMTGAVLIFTAILIVAWSSGGSVEPRRESA